MFLLKVTHAAYNPFGSTNSMSGKFYKLTKEIQHNTILNRATIEVLGADLPTVATELVGRNWRSAVESGFRITYYLFNSMIIPTLLMPLINKISSYKHELPKAFQKPFLIQFEDLIPEKKTKEGNKEFVENLKKTEGAERVKDFFGEDSDLKHEKINEFKEKMVKAKSLVFRLDSLLSGILTFFVPWTTEWFSKTFLGVTAFAGEYDLLDDSQKEESVQFHEKTKIFKFIGGLLITVFGSHWSTNIVNKAVGSTAESMNGKNFSDKAGRFVRSNLKHFDYYNQIYANRLNLASTFLFGGDAGFLLGARTINEVIERFCRISVFIPTLIFGIEGANSKFCEWSDKKHGTKTLDYKSPKELGSRRVKSLEELEEELVLAKNANNVDQIQNVEKAIKLQSNNYWKSILASSAVLGVGLTAANIVGTKIRVEKFGIY